MLTTPDSREKGNEELKSYCKVKSIAARMD